MNPRDLPVMHGPVRQQFRLISTHFGQQSENLDIEPNECHRQSKGGIPFHPLRRPGRDPVFDKVEIKNQVQCSDSNHNKAENDANRTVVEDQWYSSVEKQLEHHNDQINDNYPDRSANDHGFESL